jgi:uncharacterized protein YjeT (DUF2065 family)
MEYWLAALGLMLVLEGLMPFLFPAVWRETLNKLSQLRDGQLRFVGLILMLSGLLLIYWMK